MLANALAGMQSGSTVAHHHWPQPGDTALADFSDSTDITNDELQKKPGFVDFKELPPIEGGYQYQEILATVPLRLSAHLHRQLVSWSLGFGMNRCTVYCVASTSLKDAAIRSVNSAVA